MTYTNSDGIPKHDAEHEATLAWLSQAEELNRQIRLRKSKIDIRRDALSVRSPVLSDMPRNPSPCLQQMERNLCEVLSLEEEVRDMEKELAVLKARMMGMIEKIENTDCQMVMIQFYLNMKSVRQTTETLHFSRGWMMKLKAQGIGELEQILKTEGELEKWMIRAES